MTRGLLFLQQFDITIKYRSGKSNANADGMSQRRPAAEKVEVPMLKVVNSITHLGDQLMLKREKATDEFTLIIIQAIQKGTPLSTHDDTFFLRDGILCCHARDVSNLKTQTVVPKSFRPLVFEMSHSRLHGPSWHTQKFGKIKDGFLWPGYEQEIRDAVRSCDSQFTSTSAPSHY